jgi:hypothetical protein
MNLRSFPKPLLALLIFSSFALNAYQQPASPPPSAQPQQAADIPVIDGKVGPCSVELTVTDADTKPVYGATVKVHIAYGFAGVRKLDLEAGTNAQGKILIKGLPLRVHNPPLEIHASKDDLTGTANYNPGTECQAKHSIMLGKVVAEKATGN